MRVSVFGMFGLELASTLYLLTPIQVKEERSIFD
jgi:hypothetical protein